jgi:transcriptional regulator with XRE-family HTH domain
MRKGRQKPPRSNKKFAANVRAQRRHLGMTKTELAALSGVHKTYVERLEKGRADPGLEVIVALARALDIPPGDLVDF